MKICINIPDSNEWVRTSKIIKIFKKRKQGKNKAYTFSVYHKNSEIYSPQLEKSIYEQSNKTKSRG